MSALPKFKLTDLVELHSFIWNRAQLNPSFDSDLLYNLIDNIVIDYVYDSDFQIYHTNLYGYEFNVTINEKTLAIKASAKIMGSYVEAFTSFLPVSINN